MFVKWRSMTESWENLRKLLFPFLLLDIKFMANYFFFYFLCCTWGWILFNFARFADKKVCGFIFWKLIRKTLVLFGSFSSSVEEFWGKYPKILCKYDFAYSSTRFSLIFTLKMCFEEVFFYKNEVKLEIITENLFQAVLGAFLNI